MPKKYLGSYYVGRITDTYQGIALFVSVLWALMFSLKYFFKN